MSEQQWRIEKFGTSFAIFEGVRRVAYFYGASEEWTEAEAKSNAKRALAKNDEAPTVCPAGPVVEGELRARLRALRDAPLARYIGPHGYSFSSQDDTTTAMGLGRDLANGIFDAVEAALTNDPPPGEQ